MNARSHACDYPASSRLRSHLPRIAYLDSFAVRMYRPTLDIVELYAGALGHLPPSFRYLLALRSLLVRPLGLSTVSLDDLARPIDTQRPYEVGDKLGRWTLFYKHPDELITGADDKHLNFRVSLLRDAGERVVLSTAVMTHNVVGRAYLRAIRPFHRYGVSRLLTRATAAGRL